jgi:hypothetical protein
MMSASRTEPSVLRLDAFIANTATANAAQYAMMIQPKATTVLRVSLMRIQSRD